MSATLAGVLRGPLRRAVARAAWGAPARVFPLVGQDAPGRVDDLRLDDRVTLLGSPRSANVLLIAGTIAESLREPAARVHDQMSHPRATVWWTDEAARRDGAASARFPDATIVGPADDLPATLLRVQRELVSGRRPSAAAVLPDLDPAPWRGVGPYGQGGTGMTGGVPFGRPLADRADDRDGLMLDQLPLRVGPFFPPFPPGLVLDVKLQGDVVQEVTVVSPASVDRAATGDGTTSGTEMRDPFRRALDEPVLVTDLERARAAHHLRWLAHALRVHGLDALASRAQRLAFVLDGGQPADRGVADVATDVITDVAALDRLLARTRALRWATAGVGVTPRDRLVGLGLGPVARAAGIAEDARSDEPAYRALGFEPVLAREAAGDARARCEQRVAESLQSLRLAATAGDRRAWGGGVVEASRGRLTREMSPSRALRALVPDLLGGQEWGDAVTTVVSLDVPRRDL